MGFLDACVRGIICFNIGMTLREGDREYYYQALDRHFPGLSGRYRAVYGNACEVVSKNSDRLMAKFHALCETHGILHKPEACFAYLRELPEKNEKLSLF